jgi:hypothetical protein
MPSDVLYSFIYKNYNHCCGGGGRNGRVGRVKKLTFSLLYAAFWVNFYYYTYNCAIHCGINYYWYYVVYQNINVLKFIMATGGCESIHVMWGDVARVKWNGMGEERIYIRKLYTEFKVSS